MPRRLALLLLLILVSPLLRAQEKPAEKKEKKAPYVRPEWLEELPTGAPGPIPALRPCAFELVISWSNLVTAGKTNIIIGDGENEDYPGQLIGRADGRSAGLARALYKYDFSMWGALDPKTLKASVFHSLEQGKKDDKKTVNTRDKLGIVSITEGLSKKGKVIDTRRIRFPANEAYDLLGAILYLRSLEFTEVGQKAAVIVHPFGGAYIVYLEYEGLEEHSTAYGKYDTLRFKVDVEGIDKEGNQLVKKKYDKFEKATLWVSDDEYRLPVEIEAKIFVGSVRATLVKRHFLDEIEEKKKKD